MVGTKPTGVAVRARPSAARRASRVRTTWTEAWRGAGGTAPYIVRGFRKDGILLLSVSMTREYGSHGMRSVGFFAFGVAAVIAVSCGARTPFDEVEPNGSGGSTGRTTSSSVSGPVTTGGPTTGTGSTDTTGSFTSGGPGSNTSGGSGSFP